MSLTKATRPKVLVVTRRTTRKNKYIDYVGEYHLDHNRSGHQPGAIWTDDRPGFLDCAPV